MQLRLQNNVLKTEGYFKDFYDSRFASPLRPIPTLKYTLEQETTLHTVMAKYFTCVFANNSSWCAEFEVLY
jgi:hypothetical protein